MAEHDLDQLPVTDADGRLIGTVTSEDVLRLDELLDETAGG
jgi:CBS domain-containing protein